MAMIHVNRGATSLGTFSEEDVREGLRSGRFAPTDLGWREGMAQWQPLSQFPEFSAASPGAVPAAGAGPIGPGPTPAAGAAPTAPAPIVSAPPGARTGLPWE